MLIMPIKVGMMVKWRSHPWYKGVDYGIVDEIWRAPDGSNYMHIHICGTPSTSISGIFNPGGHRIGSVSTMAEKRNGRWYAHVSYQGCIAPISRCG